MNKSKIALICWVRGQDGAYLAKFLIEKIYEVWDTSPDTQGNTFANLSYLDVQDKVKTLSMVPEAFRSISLSVKQSTPDESYYLAGQSSVGISFDMPTETIQPISIVKLNILETCRLMARPAELYHTGSSECFADTREKPANEKTPYHPQKPYVFAKASASWLVDNYRDAYDLFACTGIVFKNESSLQPTCFVTQKFITTSYRIAQGSTEMLCLGRLDIARNWG